MRLKVGLNLMGSDARLGPRFERVLALAREADERGIDMLTFPDHLAIGASAFEQPLHFGEPFPFPREMAWYEPVTALAALAAVTRRARLSVNVLVAPLRPALFIAKQIATLDVISEGRVSLGMAGGWHEAEFAASGISLKGRFGRLEEQIAACRALWGGAPASFHQGHVHFDELYAMPLPVQGSAIPIYLGLPATGRHVERIARLADGWSWGYVADPLLISEGLARIQEARARLGRNLEQFEVKAFPLPILAAGGGIDLAATFACVPALVEAGVTIIEPNLYDYCTTEADIPRLLDQLNALQRSYA
ncbi:MAG: TIGR03619 family F420-dependent LLM class oxidoreductase [Proteobacteria bacterium]|nr:TIGR03619 family F420-dependent LLM class oxidoreductase [Pseudomonadota bacterium]